MPRSTRSSLMRWVSIRRRCTPISEKQAFFNQLQGAKVVKEGLGERVRKRSSPSPMRTSKSGASRARRKPGRVTLKEFIANGGYQVKRELGDVYSSFLGHSAFIKDPEASPLKTKSGKFEITSQAKADLFNSIGLVDHEYKPYPEYLVPTTGYETTFKDGKIGGEAGEYPYLLFNPHYFRRSHSVFDNCPWMRETWPNPCSWNASDAAEKGIVSGDTVRILTPARRGSCVRRACSRPSCPARWAFPTELGRMDENEEYDLAGC